MEYIADQWLRISQDLRRCSLTDYSKAALYKEHNEIWRKWCGFLSAQIRQLCFITVLLIWKWASSVHKMFHSHSPRSSTQAQNRNVKFCRLSRSAGKRCCTSDIFRDSGVTPFKEYFEPWQVATRFVIRCCNTLKTSSFNILRYTIFHFASLHHPIHVVQYSFVPFLSDWLMLPLLQIF